MKKILFVEGKKNLTELQKKLKKEFIVKNYKKPGLKCPVCHGRKTVKVDYLDVSVLCPACNNGHVSARLFFRLKGKLISQFFDRIVHGIREIGSAIMETFFGEYVQNRYKDGEK